MNAAIARSGILRGSRYTRKPPITRRLGVIAAGATFLMLLAMTIGTTLGARAVLNSQSEQRFSDVVSGASNSVRADLDKSFAEMAALEAFIRTDSELTNDSFEIFASTLVQRTAGADAVGFAPLVSRTTADQFIVKMESEGVELRDFSPGSTPADRFPVAYVFPPLEGVIEPGGNLATDPRFGTPTQQSLVTRSPTASGPVTLRTNPSAQPWFFVFQPVFGDPELGKHPSEGPLMGYAFSVYRTADFLAGALDRNQLGDLPLQVFDSTSGRSSTLIFPELDASISDDLPSGWVQTSLDFAGRRWILQFETPDQFGLTSLERNVWLITLAAGLGLTVFASVSMFSLLRARSVAVSDLDLMTSQMRVIVGSAIEGIVVLDAKNRLLLANRSFADAFGLPDPDILSGKEWTAVRESASVEFIDRNGFFEMLGELNASRIRTIASMDVVLTAPVHRTLSMSSSPVTDVAGEYVGRLFVFRDVTAERSAEAAKSDFVSMVSHELRTPLTSIVGYVDLLTEGAAGEQNPETARLLNVVSRNGNRLARLVADILDLSRIDSAQFDLEPSEVEVPALISESTESLAADLKTKNQEISVKVKDGVQSAFVDRVRLGQILTNLLSNAHRYTPEGGRIAVEVSTSDRDLVIKVSDNGVGISREDQLRVFERFARVGKNSARPEGSTGLGLAITKALVELHGGTISVDSEPGRGSEFTVNIPLKTTNQSAA